MGYHKGSLNVLLSCLKNENVSERLGISVGVLAVKCMNELRNIAHLMMTSALKTHYSCWKRLVVCRKHMLVNKRETIFGNICGEIDYKFTQLNTVLRFNFTVGFRSMLDDWNINLTITKLDVPLNPTCKGNFVAVIARVGGEEHVVGGESYCHWHLPKTLLLGRYQFSDLLVFGLITLPYQNSNYDIKMLYRPFISNSFAVVQQHPYQNNKSIFEFTDVWHKALTSVSLSRVKMLIKIQASSHEQRLTLRIAGVDNRKIDSLTDIMFSVHDGPDASMPYAPYITNSSKWSLSGFVAVLEIDMAVGVEEAKYARVVFNTEESDWAYTTSLFLHDTTDKEVHVGGTRHYESILVHVDANEDFVEVSVVDLDTNGFFWETCDYGGILLGESVEERPWDEFPFDPYCDPSLEGATIWTSHGRFLRVFLFAYGADAQVKLKVRATACQGYVACTENLTPLTNRSYYETPEQLYWMGRIVPKRDKCVNIHFPSTSLHSWCGVTVMGEASTDLYRIDLTSHENSEVMARPGYTIFRFQCSSVMFGTDTSDVNPTALGPEVTVVDQHIVIYTHHPSLSRCPASYAFVSATVREERCPDVNFHPMDYQSYTEIMTWHGQCATVLFTPRVGDSHRLLIQPRNPPRGAFVALTASRHDQCNTCLRLVVYDNPFRFSVDLHADYDLDWHTSGPQARIDLDTDWCEVRPFTHELCDMGLLIQLKYTLNAPGNRYQSTPASLGRDQCAFNHAVDRWFLSRTLYKVISSSRELSWLEARSLCQDSGFYLWSPSTRIKLKDVLSAAYPYPEETPQAKKDGCSSLRQLFNTTVAYIGLTHNQSSVSFVVIHNTF